VKGLEIQSCEEGLLLPVKAQPGARRNEIRGVQDGALKVSVTQVAEQGKANEAIREQLAKSLRLRRSQVELASGPTASQKRFLLRDIEREELERRLADLLDGSEASPGL
jgi:uncharacterized protein (TIGR00251 family)